MLNNCPSYQKPCLFNIPHYQLSCITTHPQLKNGECRFIAVKLEGVSTTLEHLILGLYSKYFLHPYPGSSVILILQLF